MTGWLIVNEYLNTEKFKELQTLFKEAAASANVELLIHTNAEFVVYDGSEHVLSKAFDKGTPDFIIFYDKDISLAKALENMQIPVFNSSEAIKLCDSKLLTQEAVSAFNHSEESEDCINTPLSFKVPFTYENIGISRESNFDFIDIIEKEIIENGRSGKAYPIILKECYSSFGMGVHLAMNKDELIDLICKYGNKECIIQEYIESASGKDVRVQMVGSNFVAAMMRSNQNDFRANITNGGVMSNFEPTEKDLSLCRNIMNCLGLDFAGIDIMHDKDGEPIFCEANSNAHFKNLYDLTGINTAEAMIKYICEKI